MGKLKLNVTVNRVVWPAPTKESDWFVLDTDQGRISGNMSWRPAERERLTVEGEWAAYRGERTFKFKTAVPNVPVNPRDQLMYVCERTSGIGPVMADAIWAARGDRWREIGPDEVPRLNGARYEAFLESISILEIEAEKSQAIAWLMGKGASIKMATAAWEKWQKETIGVVQSDCYRLAELEHFCFTHVDGSIRVSFGIGDTDPRRISAAVIYVLRQLTGYGSTAIEWGDVRNAAVKLIGSCNVDLIVERVKVMFQDGTLKGFPGTRTVALGEDYRNESLIWEWVTGKAV